MQRFIPFFISLLLGISSFSQKEKEAVENYYLNLNSAFCTSEISAKILAYEKAFTFAIPTELDAYNLSRFYYMMGDVKNGNKTLKKSILLGHKFKYDSLIVKKENYIPEYYLEKLDLKNPIDSLVSLFSEKKYIKLRKKYKKKCRKTDETPILFLLKNESYFHELREKAYDSISIEIFGNIGNYSGSINAYFLWDLIKSNSLPERGKSFYLSEKRLYILLNHAIPNFLTKTDAEKFLVDLKKMIWVGKITPSEYAKIYDHYYMNYKDNNKSYYGTGIEYRANGERYAYPLNDKSRINEIRYEVLLPDFDCYIVNMGLLIRE